MNTRLIDADAVPVVNREKEIREATNRMDQMLADQPVSDCVLFFYGVPQVGKTTLLGEIKRKASKQGFATALIDFDHERVIGSGLVDARYEGRAGQLQIVKHFMDGLISTGHIASNQLITSDLEPQIAVERLLSFAYDLQRVDNRRPFLLLFDTIEDSNLDNWLWMQETIIERFVNEFNTLVVIGSRTPPNMGSRRDLIYPLERRMVSFQIRSFDIGQTNRQIAAIGVHAKDLSLSVTEIGRYTGGLPGFNDAAVRWLVEQRPKDGLSVHLADIIFKRLARRTEVDAKAETLAVSPLRQFDAGLLGKIVREIWPDRYSQPGIKPIRELINRLLDTSLVEPHPDGYGYTIPFDLRVVLNDYCREMDPLKHFRIHQIAAQWFSDQVDGGDFVAVADRLYHLRSLAYDLEAHVDFAISMADSFRPDPVSGERIMNELRNALAVLKEAKGARAFDTTNKIKRVLQQPEFPLIFDPQLLNQLIEMCEDFNNQL